MPKVKPKCKNGSIVKKGSPRRLKVDGEWAPKTKTGKWTRYKVCEDGTLEKVNSHLWTDEANDLWNKLIASGVNMDTPNIQLKTPKPKPVRKKQKIKKENTKPKTKLEPEKEPESKSVENEQSNDLEQSCIELLKTLRDDVKKLTLESKEYQKLLKCVEEKNIIEINENKINTDSLYPELTDPNFSKKIALKKEFDEVKIEQKTREEIENIEQVATELCSPDIPFELEPYQMFVRNFLSSQTPYNGLLLFHGLGTGKTCSSIQICEDMRTYFNQIGIKKKIIIVASPVVQENYKLQLFDERKLKLVDGDWNLKSCTGNKFIKEVNPMNMKDLPERKVIQLIKKKIRQSYEFMGYTEFTNKINNLIKSSKGSSTDKEIIKKRKISTIRKIFSDRMLVIDEIHNMRSGSSTNKLRRTLQNLKELVMYSQNMKLMMLTATPMFNDYREIIWLTNLLNLNDNRFPISISDVFDHKGDFIVKDGEQIGKNLLIQKLTGYVSYVSGENPFKFPYRIWPIESNNPHSIRKLLNEGWEYPTEQINTTEITEPINYLDLVITVLHEEQDKAYNYVIEKTKERHPELNNPQKGIQYTVIDAPEQALNIIYPHENIDNGNLDYKGLFGKTGLGRVMIYDKNTKKQFKYSQKTLDTFGRIFNSDDGENSPLRKYSAKIYSIMNTIKNSEGIVLIYSTYIDGGCVPVALALEEIGITRWEKQGGRSKSLFENAPKKSIGRYVMITGDKQLSPSNKKELKACTDPENINGEKVRVIIISRAGSEGLDFKNIRQVHILEPWYNMNRADQIIGRGVRNKSHCNLPFDKRTVEIFLYGSQLLNRKLEPIDLYVYRLAEKKAIKIGQITRLLKENSVDCLLNISQQDMIETNMNKQVELNLSTGNKIKFNIGHKSNSIICDFMECNYNCNPNSSLEGNISIDSYSKSFIIMNLDKILKRIKSLFKEHYIYNKEELISRINVIKNYPLEQINMALETLIKDKREYVSDMLNRDGRLVNIGNLYLFQPIELNNINITEHERTSPIDNKARSISVLLNEKFNFKQQKVEETIKKSILKDDDNDILNLQKDYFLCTNTSNKSKNKTWIQSAPWVIDNLIKYDGIDENMLKEFCLDHLFDSLTINVKFNIINQFIKTQDKLQEEFKIMLDSVLSNYTFENNNVYGFACSDYKMELAKEKGIPFKVFMFIKEKNTWTTNFKKTNKDHILLLSLMQKKFSYSNVTNFNKKLIGFLTKNLRKKRGGTIFKLKSVEKGKKEKGQQCPSKGENKSVILDRINYLIKQIDNTKPDKYIMDKKNKNKQSDLIYGMNDDTKQFVNVNSKRKKQLLITDVQLCVETELLLRYLDKKKQGDSKWFFTTLDDAMSDISKLRYTEE